MLGLEGALPLGKAGQGAGILRCVVDGVECSCTGGSRGRLRKLRPALASGIYPFDSISGYHLTLAKP
jgi:hypothetical protein